MKLSKAIEILTLDVKGNTKISYDDWQNALKLGIEALKMRLETKRAYPHLPWQPLPGETPEET